VIVAVDLKAVERQFVAVKHQRRVRCDAFAAMQDHPGDDRRLLRIKLEGQIDSFNHEVGRLVVLSL
jgi:hypothetical protein